MTLILSPNPSGGFPLLQPSCVTPWPTAQRCNQSCSQAQSQASPTMPSARTPTASTSSTPYPLASSAAASHSDLGLAAAPGGEDEGPTKKRKKLPSCDSCKLRRVLCMPQAPPGSCPRCQEKGIVCTTTPVIRKKPTGRTGKRIEEARATFGSADMTSPHLTGPSNTPWIPVYAQQRLTAPSRPTVSSADLDSRLGMMELSGELAAHLLGLYQHVPQSWLPLFPRGRISILFEAAGRRLDALPPQTEVLAHTIIALTCRLSSHPALLGPGPPPPSFDSLTPAYLSAHNDLRDYGRRREAACDQLREKAVRLAWERGTMVEAQEDSMACCHLLEMLEGRNNPKAGKPYGGAFVSHLRTLLDETDMGGVKVMNMSLGWSSLIMREALYAANVGRVSHFTAEDDLLLCGEAPLSIEEALIDTVDDVDVRDSVTLFFGPMRPYTYHAARLARECSNRITGTHSRRQPLNERFVSKFLTQLDHLYQLLTILDARIAFVLSPAATSAHSLPAPFEQERQYIMRACLYTLQLAWCSLSLPVYVDLRRRIESLKRGPTLTMAERRRTRERYEVLLKQVYGTTLKGARMVAQCVKGAPSLAFLTHLQEERLGSWIEILMEAKTSEEGGEGISRAEKVMELGWMLDGLKKMGWSWSDDELLVDSLEAGLLNLTLNASPPSTSLPPTLSNDETLYGDPPSPSLDLPIDPALTSLDYGVFYSTSQSPSTSATPFDLDALLSAPLFEEEVGGMPMEEVFGTAFAGTSASGLAEDWMTL